jgi:putative glycosyltransferase (TIGR04372 family)
MFICSTDGIAGIPLVFRTPIVFVNFMPVGYMWTWSKDCLFIPKKLWLRQEKRFLTFRETFETGVAWFVGTNQYDEFDIETIENTAEEISDLVIEMDERLNGTWQTTDEDEQLQRSFWSLFKPVEYQNYFLSRIGADFLRQNKKLLT